MSGSLSFMRRIVFNSSLSLKQEFLHLAYDGSETSSVPGWK